jgi:DNA-binding transcriptional MerR regulator
MKSFTSTEVMARTGVSFRRLNHWATKGYVIPEGEQNPGSGIHRRWTEDELRRVQALEILSKVGVLPHEVSPASLLRLENAIGRARKVMS